MCSIDMTPYIVLNVAEPCHAYIHYADSVICSNDRGKPTIVRAYLSWHGDDKDSSCQPGSQRCLNPPSPFLFLLLFFFSDGC